MSGVMRKLPHVVVWQKGNNVHNEFNDLVTYSSMGLDFRTTYGVPTQYPHMMVLKLDEC